MSLFRRASSNLIWVTLSDVLAKGATIFATIYLARILGVTEFGVLSLGIAIAGTVWPLVDLGTNGYGIREVARNPASAQTLMSSLNSMRLAASVVVIIATGIIIHLLGFEDSKKWTVLATLVYLSAHAISPDWVVRGLERMSIGFAMNSIAAVSFILGTVVFVSGPDDTAIAGLVRSVAFGIGSVAGILILRGSAHRILASSLRTRLIQEHPLSFHRETERLVCTNQTDLSLPHKSGSNKSGAIYSIFCGIDRSGRHRYGFICGAAPTLHHRGEWDGCNYHGGLSHPDRPTPERPRKVSALSAQAG